MMIIHEKKGNIFTSPVSLQKDWLQLEWFETSKRIWHKKTEAGRELSARFLSGNPQLKEGDILFEAADFVIVVDIIPAETIVIFPADMQEMAAVSYEIGNKHLPLFFDNNSLLVPFDMSLFRLLSSKGYRFKEELRKLSQPLQTTVLPHGTSIPLPGKT